MSKKLELIIGITETNGSGKGTVVKRLVKRWGFDHQSARAVITREIKKRKLPVNRNNLIEVAYDLRTKYGPDIFAKRMYKKAKEGGGKQVLESLRSPAEVEFLRQKQKKFMLLAVDANIKLRFQRIKKRGSATDNETFISFKEKEEREMESNDPNSQNIGACIEIADSKIENNGTIEKLNNRVDEIIKEVL
jgi:dephospho-CoA kinase